MPNQEVPDFMPDDIPTRSGDRHEDPAEYLTLSLIDLCRQAAKLGLPRSAILGAMTVASQSLMVTWLERSRGGDEEFGGGGGFRVAVDPADRAVARGRVCRGAGSPSGPVELFPERMKCLP